MANEVEMRFRWRTIIAVLSGLALVGLFSRFVEPVLQNGDSAVYNEQVDTRNFEYRTTHIGYIALGVVARFLVPALETDWVMNLMTVVVGVSGLLAVFFSAVRLTGSWLASATAAITLLGVPTYLRGMLLSEVDVPLAAFVAMSFSAMLYERTVLAGVLFGCAMLISPLGAFGLPALVLARLPNFNARRTWWVWFKTLVVFGAVSLAVYLPVVLAHFDDYVHGNRGILGTGRMGFDLALHVRRSQRFAEKELGFLLIPLLWGAAMALVRRRYGFVLGVFGSTTAALVFGERFNDVPVQLSSVALAAPLLSLGIAAGPTAVRVGLAASVLALFISRAIPQEERVQREIQAHLGRRNMYLGIKRTSPAPPLIVGPRNFQELRTAERTLFGSSYTGRVISVRDLRRRCRSIARSEERYVIWFLRGAPKIPCRQLRKRYRPSTLTVEDRTFHVLLPVR